MLGDSSGFFDDDPRTMLAGIMSPTSASDLVGPPPDSPPPHVAGRTTPLTGSLARPPQEAVAKNLDTAAGRQSYNTAQNTGISNPPNGGYVNSISQAQPVQPAQQVRPAQQVQPAQVNPDPNGSLRPGGSTPGALPVLHATPTQVQGPSALDTAQSRLAALTNGGPGWKQIQNPIGRVAAGIGDAALSFLSPSTAANTPGTTLHNQQLISRGQGVVGNLQGQQTAQAQQADIASQTQERLAKGAMESGANQTKLGVQDLRNTGSEAVGAGHDAARAATAGLTTDTDATGNKTYESDPNSPITQYKVAQGRLAQANAAFAAAKNDPNSFAGKIALAKIQAENSATSVARIRANAYALNATGANYGTDPQGNPLNAIGMIGGKPVGTRVLPGATKAMGNIAKFQDVYSSIDNANDAIDEGAKHGVKFNTAAMAEALSDPKTTSSQWLAGKVNTTLSPQEQNIVITTKALHEQIMAMRGAIGSGGVSDTQANRLIAQLPSATTPDMGYARKQLATVRGQLDRLQAGLPGVNRGPALQAPGSPANPTNPGGVPKGIPPAQAGGQIPPQAAKQLQEGKVHTFNNGQQWTLQNGQPKRVQ